MCRRTKKRGFFPITGKEVGSGARVATLGQEFSRRKAGKVNLRLTLGRGFHLDFARRWALSSYLFLRLLQGRVEARTVLQRREASRRLPVAPVKSAGGGDAGPVRFRIEGAYA